MTSMMMVTDVATGERLDRVTLDEQDALRFQTGVGRPLFQSLLDLGSTQREAFDLRAAWSNGYVRTGEPFDPEEVPDIPGLREQVTGALTAATPPSFRFDPAQKRDGGGRWTVFGGVPLSRQELHLGDGKITLEARADGLHIDLADRTGRANRSGALDYNGMLDLASALENAADPDFAPDEAVTRSVHTFEGGRDDSATGYAQVTHGGGGSIRLELLDSDAEITLDPAEARVLADDVHRIGAARRVDIESGPLDIFLPGGHRVGLRTTGLDGEPVDTRLDGDDWRDLWYAADVLWEGFDEQGELADPEEDLDHVTVNTESGPLEMSRIGEPNDKASRIRIESPGKFVIEFRTDIDDPIWEARQPATEYGQANDWIDE